MRASWIIRFSVVATLALTIAGCRSAPAEAPGPAQFLYAPVSSPDPTGVTPGIELLRSALAPMPFRVDAAMKLSGPGYAMVLAVNEDGALQVLYPEAPSDSCTVTPAGVTVLPRLYSGYARRRGGEPRADAGRESNRFLPRGVVLGFASDAPLQLARFADGNGDWNIKAIERLLHWKSATDGSQLLGSALAADGHRVSVGYTQIGGSFVTLLLVDGRLAREARVSLERSDR